MEALGDALPSASIKYQATCETGQRLLDTSCHRAKGSEESYIFREDLS
jgi:hypothetical protein